MIIIRSPKCPIDLHSNIVGLDTQGMLVDDDELSIGGTGINE